MEWLSNDMCEGFANCGISVDGGGSSNVTQSLADKTHTNTENITYKTLGDDRDFTDSNFSAGNGIICSDDMKGRHCDLDFGLNASDTHPARHTQGPVLKPKYEIADSSMTEFCNVSENIHSL